MLAEKKSIATVNCAAVELSKSALLCDQSWVKLSDWPSVNSKKTEELRIVDLFSGCGGMTLGAWEAARRSNKGLSILLAVEKDIDAHSVYMNNFKRDARCVLSTDIKELFSEDLSTGNSIREIELEEKLSDVDLLVAGPPCQGHSDLNNKTRRNDPRNSLYLRAIRAVKVLKPKCAIIENVPTVIHDTEGVVFRSDEYLTKLGYHTTSIIVNAIDFGVPQKRKRHILIATQKPFHKDIFTLSEKGRVATLKEYIKDIENEHTNSSEIFRTASKMQKDNSERADYLIATNSYDLPNHLRPPCHQKKHSYISMYGRLHWDKPSQTITSGFGSMGQGRYLHPQQKRTLTPHEAARIQGFPDFFEFSAVKKRTKLQEMIANAVPPAVIANLVAHFLHEGLFDER